MLTDRSIWETLPGLPLLSDTPMCGHTSFCIGGPADLLAVPRDREELAALLALAAEHETPVFPMGCGANLLVSDKGIRGLVVKTHPGLDFVERLGESEISAGAGALLSSVASAAADWGLSGLAFAYGIPGTVGGAMVMNAGAYGGEMSQVVRKVRGLSRFQTPMELSNEEAAFAYRCSYFAYNPDITVISAVFKLQPGDREAIWRDMNMFWERRRASQPLEYPSAGSVFKRPPGYFAGKLIQDCGLKGAAIGDAQVSEKHTGFIINRGGATCEDVKRLIAHIQETVLARCGVELACELKFVGE